MALDKSLYTPIAVVAGCSVIGACLFFALRRPESTQQATASSTSSAATSPTPRETSSPTPITPPPRLDASVGAPPSTPAPAGSSVAYAAVGEALGAQKKKVAEKCLGPVDGKPMPPRKLFVEYNFDANGKALTQSVQQDREAGPPWVSECVQRALAVFDVPPSGAPLRLVYEWTVP